MTNPTRLERIFHRNTHRLVASKYTQMPLKSLSPNVDVVGDLAILANATDEGRLAEIGKTSGIGPRELVFAIPEATLVNNAFEYASPYGGRFNTPARGAWYAGLEFQTAVGEVSFHRRLFLKKSGIKEPITYAYTDVQADFTGNYHVLEPELGAIYLQPDPVPACYKESQRLAERLLASHGNGLVYPSVRNPNGKCIVCFRPALVNNVRTTEKYELTVQFESKTLVAAV